MQSTAPLQSCRGCCQTSMAAGDHCIILTLKCHICNSCHPVASKIGPLLLPVTGWSAAELTSANCSLTGLSLLLVLLHAGGYSKWLKAGLNTAPSLPKYLQAAGYNTYYVGKFLVEYSLYNYRPVPDGEREPRGQHTTVCIPAARSPWPVPLAQWHWVSLVTC